MLVSRKTIHLIENHRDELPSDAVIAWDYYNMSIYYQMRYPNHYDSIYYFLNKTLESMARTAITNNEIEISVYISLAGLNFEQKKYEQAEKYMLHALSLLEQAQDMNNVVVEFSEAYQFLAKLYETMSRPLEALKYQKLLLENEKRRYDIEKINSINDMMVKHETEKKNIRIQTLVKEYKATQRILWLTIGLSIALLLTFTLIFLSSRLKRKNMEQQLYETALLAELRQNELEKIQNQKQELELQPVKTIIEKIAWLIEKSIIEKITKKDYIERLSKIDSKLLEQAYQNSKVKITGMDMKYIICFSADIDVRDISLLFNIEPASVNTVRYRIKKKLV